MRRFPYRFPTFAVLTVLLAAPAAVASGAEPEKWTVVRVELDLKASNGLDAHLENSEDGTVTLELRGNGQIVTYEVPGEATEAGLKVRFGRLGTIDVAFAPTTTLSSTEPGPGCTGAPRTLREGVFAGTIDFTGERGFVRIEGPQATGSMSVIPPWQCPEAEAMDPFARASLLTGSASRRGKSERETATLSAYDGSCSCYFAAGVHHRRSGGRSIFGGARVETREGMEIVRMTQARGPASLFDFDHAKGTATLRAPSPLSGRASLRTLSSGRTLWRSTIQVPLLGADPLDTGTGFTARLQPEYQFD